MYPPLARIAWKKHLCAVLKPTIAAPSLSSLPLCLRFSRQKQKLNCD